MDEDNKPEVEEKVQEEESLEAEKKVKKNPVKKKLVKKKPAKKKTVKKAEKKQVKAETKPEKKVKKAEPQQAVEKKEPITFSHKKKSKKHSGGKFGLISFSFIIILLIAGAWYQTNQVSEETKDAASGLREEVSTEVGKLQQKLQELARQLENQNKADVPEIKTYTSERMKISFEYPAELGTVNVEELKQEITGDIKVGQPPKTAVYLTFSANPDIWITAITGEYEDTSANRYGGEADNLLELCDDPLDITDTGYCDLRSFADQQTIEKVITLGDEELTGIMKYVPLNLRKQEFHGLTVNVSLGLPPVSGRNLFVKPSQEDSKAALDEFFGNLLRGDGLSLVTQENLAAYDAILESLKMQQ